MFIPCVRYTEHKLNKKFGNFGIMNTKEAIYSKAIGKKIRNLREEKGFDQRSFAFECAISRTQLHMIENGKTNPRLSSLYKIANQLGITVSDLLNA